jgi:hypothetical protein
MFQSGGHRLSAQIPNVLLNSPKLDVLNFKRTRTMSNSESKLRTREWLLIIVALVIGEYVFIDKVFRYRSDQGVIGYVSFAGTIVSIILAVLAIVYSYYQNFAQKRDSSNIAAQVDLLRATVSDVRLSKAEFAEELKRIMTSAISWTNLSRWSVSQRPKSLN